MYQLCQAVVDTLYDSLSNDCLFLSTSRDSMKPLRGQVAPGVGRSLCPSVVIFCHPFSSRVTSSFCDPLFHILSAKYSDIYIMATLTQTSAPEVTKGTPEAKVRIGPCSFLLNDMNEQTTVCVYVLYIRMYTPRFNPTIHASLCPVFTRLLTPDLLSDSPAVVYLKVYWCLFMNGKSHAYDLSVAWV